MILINIAMKFDEICVEHSIPYYMIGGTLLGAIRHKGFIPWDDDMDFGVPMEHYDRMLSIMEKELKEPYRLCTYKTVKGCDTVFAKIEDMRTCINDKCQDLPLEEQIGLNIDIFPLNHCDGYDIKIKKLQFFRYINRLVFTESTDGTKYKHIIKKILRFLFPFSHDRIRAEIWKRVTRIDGTHYIANLLGVNGKREIIPISVWGKSNRYSFEDYSFEGPENADHYLKHIYGNYMELPPINSRQPHASEVFYR